MSAAPYFVSLAVGLAVGILYGLLAVRSPAPPVIALLGLLGMLAGESFVQWVRGHGDAIARVLHTKDFAHTTTAHGKRSTTALAAGPVLEPNQAERTHSTIPSDENPAAKGAADA